MIIYGNDLNGALYFTACEGDLKNRLKMNQIQINKNLKMTIHF